MVETGVGNPAVRLCEIRHGAGSCGFNVSRSRWDPYPWVSTVDADSPAAAAGVLPGDCLLEVNGEDMLGLRVSEVAARVRARGDRATVMLWNTGAEHPSCTPETLCCGPMPTNLHRLTTCMTNILEALECPICLDTIPPPAHQCVNGHLICVGCRARTDRCPVCRLRLFRGRSLLADQVFDALIDAFDLRQEDETERTKMLVQRVYGPRKKEKKHKPEIKINFLSPTNKFLTRIMGSGKSTSVDDLSAGHLDSGVPEDMGSGLKVKSLSSNEIFRAESLPVSRASSVLSSRPGSGLLDVNDALGPRPASYHGSGEDLRARLIADFGLDISVPRSDACSCPLAPACTERVPAAALKGHLQQHDTPLIQFGRPKASIHLHWLKDAVLVLECFGTLFFVRAIPSERIWIWTVDDHSVEYSASVRVEGSSFHCSVIPLTQLNVKEINFNGIPLCNVADIETKIEITISRS